MDDRHAMSVIVGILDTETLKHTADLQGANANVEALKRKVSEFTNMLTAGIIPRKEMNRCEHYSLHEHEEES